MTYEEYRKLLFEYASGEKSFNLTDFSFREKSIPISKEDRDDGLSEHTQYEWYDKSTKVAEVYIMVWPDNWISCHDLEISKKYRGYHLGNQLVEFIVKKGVNHLSVSPNNKIAIRLYEKYGFKLTGEKEGNLLRMERK